MKRHYILLQVLFLLFLGCSDNKKDIDSQSTAEMKIKMPTTDFSIEKFSFSYPNDLIFDSNELVFYCKRSFDTSSLLHLQKSKSGINGFFYEILPSYHQFADDFANQKAKLLFFEGYSFLIDSSTWKSIQNNLQVLLQLNDNLNKNDKQTDGDLYTLYYNGQIKQSHFENQILYETFDKFLKNIFLQNFIDLRKPKAYQIKNKH